MKRPTALLLPLLAVACDSPTAPLPSGAREFTPPAAYGRWWALTEACSGRAPVAAGVRWYAVPDDSVRTPEGRWAAGYWDGSRSRIVLGERWRQRGDIVRHEMLHALLGPRTSGHPPAYFQGRCGGWVVCSAVGCADAGAPFAPPPADAPVLAAADLRLTVEVLPPSVTRVPGDSGATVVVRVTNPRPVPVWVQLAPPPGCPATCPEFAGFGYGIGRSGREGTSQGAIVATAGRFPLEAGSTKLLAFDADLAGYPAGAYVATASFNEGDLSFAGPRAVAVPFQIAR